MSENAPVELSLSSVLRASASLVIMYLLATIRVAHVLVGMGVALSGVLLTVQCALYGLSLPLLPPLCGRDLPRWISSPLRQAFQAKGGITFGKQFGRNVIVLFPGWFVPPVVGMYLLVTGFAWCIVILLVLFCPVGFLLLPTDSQRHCTGCENLDCPRRKAKSTMTEK